MFLDLVRFFFDGFFAFFNFSLDVENNEVYQALSTLRGTVNRIDQGDSDDDYSLRIKLVACGDGAVGFLCD